MSTPVIPNSSQPTEAQTHNYLKGPDETIVTAFSYEELTEFHLKRRAIDKDGNVRPQQSLDNEQSVIGDWLASQKLQPSDPVGEELRVRFAERCSDYLTSLQERGLAKRTIRDRKSIVTQLRGSYLELQRTDGLPEDYGGALKMLIKKAGASLPQLTRKIDVSHKTLLSWIGGTSLPRPKSIPQIRKLEKVLKVSPGTLSSRLPEAHWTKQPVRKCATLWRQHQSILSKLRYRLSALTALLLEEWGELLLFFTDPQWVSERGFETNSEWRVRWNTNRCHTAEINLESVRGFFGFLCQPVSAPDKRIAGLGFTEHDLTLALLTDADLVLKYLHFMKGRSVSGSFNGATITFLSLCTMLTRDKTGYLRQRPEFGARLPQPVAEGDWPSWCERNRLEMLEFRADILNGRKGRNGKKDRVRMTRNPFEPVIDIIRERQHPLTALFDLASRLESLTPLLERGSEKVLAVHNRSIFQVRLISSNPLRSENFSMMTYVPKDHGEFERARELFPRHWNKKRPLDFSELYVETTGDSNLYQRKDGSWYLRFGDRDFKNERGEDVEFGVRNEAYDVPIVPSVWPVLTEYLLRHRPVLNRALRDAIQRARAQRGLPSMSPEEEFAILRCPYVFRPSCPGIRHLGAEQLEGYGVGQMSVVSLSAHILCLTSRFLPESKGFSAHACRHLVATEYIKNHPEGWEVAAIALHNTVDMVRRHYSWLDIGDQIKPWNNYHEWLKESHDRGEI